MTTRRDFLRIGLASILGTAAAGPVQWWPRQGHGAIQPPVTASPGNDGYLPRLEVHGTRHDVGIAIGRTFGMEIQGMLQDRKEWFKRLKDFATGSEGRKVVEAMRSAASKYTPGVLEEMSGTATASGVPHEDLFILNCKNEIDAFANRQEGTPGCSTVVVREKDRLLVMHNEDGDVSFRDRMFLLRADIDDGPEIIMHTYPGIVPGNASWLNEHGVCMTTNYIPSASVRAGVPRYFLYRLAAEAETVEAAIKILTHPERAYAGHHVVASLASRKARSVEITSEKVVDKEIAGVFFHTNHLICEGMAGEPQFDGYIANSSRPRYESLTTSLSGLRPADATQERVLKALSDHAGKPTAVCRHPKGEVRGTTVGLAMFESAKEMQAHRPFVAEYCRGNPCTGKRALYPVG